MALSILDGTQTATTLSTILSSGQHITAHTVVSLGTQAVTDMRSAVSGSVVSISNFPPTQPVSIASVTIGSLPLIAGTVTANAGGDFAEAIENSNDVGNINKKIAVQLYDDSGTAVGVTFNPLPISGTVTVGNTVTIAGTVTANPTGTQTIAGSVTLGAGTAQIGSVTASISNFPATQAISIASVTIGNSVTIASLPAISGTVTVGSLPAIFADPSGFQSVVAGISDVEVNTIRSVLWIPQENGSDGEMLSQVNPLPIVGRALQGTAVTTSNFTSTTASTLLAGFNATREVLTIFNEGASNLFVCPGATCTTIAYQVRLSAGDYYEVPNSQTSITHSAVFATAGTARVTQVS